MSRVRTQRPVLTALQKKAEKAELRRRLSAELPTHEGVDRMAGSGLSAAIARVSALKVVAAEAGISTTSIDDLTKAIDALVVAAPLTDTFPAKVPVVQNVLEQVTSLEDQVIASVCDARTIELTGAAVAEALRRVGLVDIAITANGQGLTITGAAVTGQHAALALSASTLHLVVEDPVDMVHALHPDAAEVCRTSESLADRIHDTVPTVLAEVGLAAGPVEVVEAATRGVGSRPIQAAAPGKWAQRGGAR